MVWNIVHSLDFKTAKAVSLEERVMQQKQAHKIQSYATNYEPLTLTTLQTKATSIAKIVSQANDGCSDIYMLYLDPLLLIVLGPYIP